MHNPTSVRGVLSPDQRDELRRLGQQAVPRSAELLRTDTEQARKVLIMLVDKAMYDFDRSLHEIQQRARLDLHPLLAVEKDQRAAALVAFASGCYSVGAGSSPG